MILPWPSLLRGIILWFIQTAAADAPGFDPSKMKRPITGCSRRSVDRCIASATPACGAAATPPTSAPVGRLPGSAIGGSAELAGGFIVGSPALDPRGPGKFLSRPAAALSDDCASSGRLRAPPRRVRPA